MGRKQKTIHYLYKTTCKVTNRFYIGIHSTNDLNDGYMGSGKRLRYSIRKHGKENHVKEILEFFNCREELVEAERNAISEDMLSDVNCMNLVAGGEGGNFLTEERRKEIAIMGGIATSEKMKTDLQFQKYKLDILAKNRKKGRELGNVPPPPNWTGKKHTQESIEKMRIANKGMGIGETNSQYGTMWITNGVENRKIKKEEVIPEGWVKGMITKNNKKSQI